MKKFLVALVSAVLLAWGSADASAQGAPMPLNISSAFNYDGVASLGEYDYCQAQPTDNRLWTLLLSGGAKMHNIPNKAGGADPETATSTVGVHYASQQLVDGHTTGTGLPEDGVLDIFRLGYGRTPPEGYTLYGKSTHDGTLPVPQFNCIRVWGGTFSQADVTLPEGERIVYTDLNVLTASWRYTTAGTAVWARICVKFVGDAAWYRGWGHNDPANLGTGSTGLAVINPGGQMGSFINYTADGFGNEWTPVAAGRKMIIADNNTNNIGTVTANLWKLTTPINLAAIKPGVALEAIRFQIGTPNTNRNAAYIFAASARPAVVAGPPALATSTVAIAPTTAVPANGLDYVTVTMTVKDANGFLMGGLTSDDFDLSTAAPAGDAWSSVTETTFGVYQVRLYDTEPTDGEVITVVCRGVTISDGSNVAIFADEGDPVRETSTVVVDKEYANNDGADAATITMTLRNASGVVISGQADYLTVAVSGDSTGLSDVTEVSPGVYRAALTDSFEETQTISVTYDDGVTEFDFLQTPTVDFYDTTTLGLGCDVTVGPLSVVADNSERATITIQLLDSRGHGLVGLVNSDFRLYVDPATSTGGNTFSTVVPTGEAGFYAATMVSSLAGAKNILVDVLAPPVTLSAANTVTFVPPSMVGLELITRDQILENAYLSYAVEFRLDSDNLYSAGQIAGATCPYSSAGWKSRLPYAWFGHDELYEFLKKMMDGKGAGDIDTSSGTPYSQGKVGGVECSGYVGECWKIPGRTFTSDIASSSVASTVPWTAVAPGDALNRSGHHVVLAEEYPYNLSYDQARVFESTTSSINGVTRRVRSLDSTFKSQYVPRRYKKVSSKPSILSVRKSGEGQVEIKWLGDVGNDSTHAQSGFRVYQSVDGVTWAIPPGQSESTLKLVNQSTIISGLSPGTTYYFKIAAMKSGQESGSSKVYAIRFDSGRKPEVLIVDGFDKWFFKAENPSNLNHDLVLSYARELDRLGIAFETVDNLVVTRSNDSLAPFLLQDYRAILYLLGDEGEAGLSRDYSLNILEQLALADYLRNGGQLFLSGSQLSEDLNDVYSNLDNIRINDAEFRSGYLKVASSTGDANTHAVASGSGIFSNVGSFTCDDGRMYYDVSAPDAINPGPGAATCLSYAGGASAGIQYQGTFGDGTATGRAVYLGLPFESIVEQGARTTIMTAVMRYFGLTAAPPEPADPRYSRVVNTGSHVIKADGVDVATFTVTLRNTLAAHDLLGGAVATGYLTATVGGSGHTITSPLAEVSPGVYTLSLTSTEAEIKQVTVTYNDGVNPPVVLDDLYLYFETPVLETKLVYSGDDLSAAAPLARRAYLTIRAADIPAVAGLVTIAGNGGNVTLDFGAAGSMTLTEMVDLINGGGFATAEATLVEAWEESGALCLASLSAGELSGMDQIGALSSSSHIQIALGAGGAFPTVDLDDVAATQAFGVSPAVMVVRCVRIDHPADVRWELHVKRIGHDILFAHFYDLTDPGLVGGGHFDYVGHANDGYGRSQGLLLAHTKDTTEFTQTQPSGASELAKSESQYQIEVRNAGTPGSYRTVYTVRPSSNLGGSIVAERTLTNVSGAPWNLHDGNYGPGGAYGAMAFTSNLGVGPYNARPCAAPTNLHGGGALTGPYDVNLFRYHLDAGPDNTPGTGDEALAIWKFTDNMDHANHGLLDTGGTGTINFPWPAGGAVDPYQVMWAKAAVMATEASTSQGLVAGRTFTVGTDVYNYDPSDALGDIYMDNRSGSLDGLVITETALEWWGTGPHGQSYILPADGSVTKSFMMLWDIDMGLPAALPNLVITAEVDCSWVYCNTAVTTLNRHKSVLTVNIIGGVVGGETYQITLGQDAGAVADFQVTQPVAITAGAPQALDVLGGNRSTSVAAVHTLNVTVTGTPGGQSATVDVPLTLRRLGDIDGVGGVNGQDKLLINKRLSGLVPNGPEFDLDGVGGANGQDKLILNKILSGIAIP